MSKNTSKNLLPIRSKEPDEIAMYLVDNVTPLYAFVYASTLCTENIYNKTLSVGFDRQSSTESMLALLYDSVKYGYFDIHKALLLVKSLEREKRKAISEQRIQGVSDTQTPLPYFAPQLLIESIRSMLLHYDDNSVGVAVKNINDYEGKVIPIWHVAVGWHFVIVGTIEDLYSGNAVYMSIVESGLKSKYPDQKYVKKSTSSAEKEMFKMFKDALNSAKSFAVG